jgi:hypothetical protein
MIRLVFRMLAVAGLLLILMQAMAFDAGDNHALKQSDFYMFYAAGHMAAHGRVGDLYKPPEPAGGQDSDFNRYADDLLPSPGKKYADVFFVYPPAMALAMAGFTALPFRLALICWQLISIAAVVGSAWIFASTQDGKSKTIDLTFMGFALFLAGSAIAIGQNIFVIGLLPLTTGYALVAKRRPYAAGLTWALLGLKPQLTIPVALMLLVLLATARGDLLKERLKLAGAWALGLALTLLVPFIVFGPSIFGWVHNLKAYSLALYGTGPAPSRNPWNLISLLLAVFFVLPQDMRAFGAVAISWCGPVLFLGELVLMYFAARKELSESRQQDILVFLALLLMPITAPYMGSVDFGLLLLALWIYAQNLAAPGKLILARLAVAICLVFDLVYVNIPQLVQAGSMNLTVLGLSCLYACFAATTVAIVLNRKPVDTL